MNKLRDGEIYIQKNDTLEITNYSRFISSLLFQVEGRLINHKNLVS